ALLFTMLAPIGGIAWTVAASELWLVEQRVASKETRGRANAIYMRLANVGLFFGGIFWGWLATIMGLDKSRGVRRTCIPTTSWVTAGGSPGGVRSASPDPCH